MGTSSSKNSQPSSAATATTTRNNRITTPVANIKTKNINYFENNNKMSSAEAATVTIKSDNGENCDNNNNFQQQRLPLPNPLYMHHNSSSSTSSTEILNPNLIQNLVPSNNSITSCNSSSDTVSLLIFTATESYGSNIRDSFLIGAIQQQYKGKLCIHYVSRKEVLHVEEQPKQLQQQQQEQQQTNSKDTVTIAELSQEDMCNIRPINNTITLEFLAQYDCVLFETFGGLFSANSEQLGTLMTQYVEQCAGGVLCFAVSNDNSYGLGGTFKAKNYHPMQYGQGYNYEKIVGTGPLGANNYLGEIVNPGHPLMKNVVQINTGEWCGHSTCGIYDQDVIDKSELMKQLQKVKNQEQAAIDDGEPDFNIAQPFKLQRQQPANNNSTAVSKNPSKVEIVAKWQKTNAPLVSVREIDISSTLHVPLVLEAMKRTNNPSLLNQITRHNTARVISINCGVANKRVQHNYWDLEDTDLPILMFNALMYASRRRRQGFKHIGAVMYNNTGGRFDKLKDIVIHTYK